MTTIVVVRKDNLVAIAADTQSTFGDTRLGHLHDAQPEKIFASHDSLFGLCGSAAHDLVLQSILAKTRALDFTNRASIFDAFRKLHPKLKEDFFLKPEEEEDDPYESSQITALIANAHGIYGVFSMREVYEYRHYWAIGSGRDFAIGAMRAVYDNPVFSAADVARIGVEVGCEFDVGSSLPMSLQTMELAPIKQTKN
ncbi:MFS transporter [Chitinimonas sp. BJB300]|uniref:MFS transporter n=1 Tax=Chitinimonas sp. BJB300 TaxID=1559339 RepID=UPI000C0D9643|nr:MFS transporter [Chitinimonas sp. BJB300]PHV10773.1 MFS transporter [Chitinimonas sp. BJB300]TSJ84518.1 MFS transporter [Chitinimonas sp. BJB300]